MLGESDLVYTETVCAMDSESFEGKEVLILGGGDGGILHELRKQNPRNIIMAEVRACIHCKALASLKIPYVIAIFRLMTLLLEPVVRTCDLCVVTTWMSTKEATTRSDKQTHYQCIPVKHT